MSWGKRRAASVRWRPAAAAAAERKWETTATAHVTQTAASWTPAANRRTVWKSAWSAAEFASRHESLWGIYGMWGFSCPQNWGGFSLEKLKDAAKTPHRSLNALLSFVGKKGRETHRRRTNAP